MSSYINGEWQGVPYPTITGLAKGDNINPYAKRIYRGFMVKGGHNDVAWPTMKPKDIADGLSKTIAVAEKSVWAKFYQSSGSPYWDDPGWAYGCQWPTMRFIGVPILADSDDQTRLKATVQSVPGQMDEQGFGSAHAGVFIALFGDGSVHPLSLNIDNTITFIGNTIDAVHSGVFARLGIRDDGQNIDSNAY